MTSLHPAEALQFCCILQRTAAYDKVPDLERRIYWLFRVRFDRGLIIDVFQQLQVRAAWHLAHELHQGGQWLNLDTFEEMVLLAWAHINKGNRAITNCVELIVGRLHWTQAESFPLFERTSFVSDDAMMRESIARFDMHLNLLERKSLVLRASV